MDEIAKVLPCPCCGDEAYLNSQGCVMCGTCGLHAESLAAWNKRPEAIAAVPVGDLKELVDAWQASAALIMRVDADSSLRLEARAYRGCADRLRALIERHRKEQK